MKHIDWNTVEEASAGFDNPTPGGYIAQITNFQDDEAKECLIINWEFADGSFVGENKKTYDRIGFWPMQIFRSYKVKALPFFKAFKTALEKSNPGYVFREEMLNQLVGKRIGVVLGEKEYRKKNGDIGTKLYVYETRSVQAIIDGDFKVPTKELLAAPAGTFTPASAPVSVQFTSFEDEDPSLPF